VKKKLGPKVMKSLTLNLNDTGEILADRKGKYVCTLLIVYIGVLYERMV